VEPVGYDSMWQKFENDVYNTVKTYFQEDDTFKVEWSRKIDWHRVGTLKPDVLLSIRCKSCEAPKEEFPCLIPAFIFDAYCKFDVEPEYFKKKDKQMQKYSEICDTILVMPQGYEQRPFCKSGNGKYHIISFHYLHSFLDSLKGAIEIEYREDSCGDRPTSNGHHVYKHFELSLRKRIDKCPSCKQRVSPISLIYCDKYDEYYYPDFLDYEVIKYGSGIFTHVECDGCGDHSTFGWDYDECPSSSIVYKYQCDKCGAIFDPETNEIIDNFDGSHLDMLEDSFPYYQEKHGEARSE
jgi:hypothetical protein